MRLLGQNALSQFFLWDRCCHNEEAVSFGDYTMPKKMLQWVYWFLDLPFWIRHNNR
ncbi:unnamed protein product [Sphenostylis stenocarpa]|uniref:Uncharacterized protein n=1 Tax=Sphenostylis stenocarpa TaxID=92480 RepID=A0AA86VNJ3_9FABA|nr:unnamed protein product [Sphenostylis stenocarpa]